jgi:hypothetical protein
MSLFRGPRPGSKSLSCLAVLILFAGALSGQTLGQGSTLVTIPEAPNQASTDTAGSETEGEMNCFEVWFPRANVRGIVPNFPDMGPDFATHMRKLAKLLTCEAVLRGETSLNGHLRGGQLYGVEFDWFFPDMPGMPPRNNLPNPVQVYLQRTSGTSTRFATVYGFGPAEYAAKKAMVEAMVGHPMETYVVWSDDVLTGTAQPIVASGVGNRVSGPISSAGSFGLLGLENAFQGVLSTVTRPLLSSGNHLQYVHRVDSVRTPSLPMTVGEARNAALDGGTYALGNLVVTEWNVPPDGVVFAEGSITLASDALSGRWTFVSATGNVSVRSDDAVLEPFVGNTAAIAFEGDVSVTGNGGLLAGELHAPRGSFDVTGSGNTLLGIFVGRGVQLTGSRNVLTDGTHPLTLP